MKHYVIILMTMCCCLAHVTIVHGVVLSTPAPKVDQREFLATDFLSVIKKENHVLEVAFSSDNFVQWHVIDDTTITDIITKLNGSKRAKGSPTREELKRRGLKRWTPVLPWIRLRVSDANKNPVSWFQFYGGGGVFSYANKKYVVGDDHRDSILETLLLLEKHKNIEVLPVKSTKKSPKTVDNTKEPRESQGTSRQDKVR